MAGEGVTQGSTLYAGSVSQAAIYRIMAGVGFQWGPHSRTEILVDGKPRQLTKGEDAGTALQANIKNPTSSDYDSSSFQTIIDGRQLSVVELAALKNFDVQDWKNTFPEYQPSGLNVDLQANPKIQEVVFDLSMNKIHTEVNAKNSSGTAGSGSYDGYETLILADADTTQVGTPAVLSASNIINYMFDLRDAVDPRLRASQNLKIFCSYADADLFDRASRATQDANVISTLDGVRSITQADGGSIPIIPIQGISKDFVFITVAGQGDDSNLVQGVWMENDIETLKMYRFAEGDQTWRILFRASLGVQFVTGKDIWYLNNAS